MPAGLGSFRRYDGSPPLANLSRVQGFAGNSGRRPGGPGANRAPGFDGPAEIRGETSMYSETDYRRIHAAAMRMRFRMGFLILGMVGCGLLMACGNDLSVGEEANGQSAALKFDWVTATPFFEQAYAAHPDVTNEFNLATAYQSTGQNAKAIPLYEDVVENGKYTLTDTGIIGQLHPADMDRAPGSQRSDLSAEAAKRLSLMRSNQADFDQLSQLQKSNASQ
jgi:hypothetical protein